MNDFNQQIIEEFRANHGKLGGGFSGAPMLLLQAAARIMKRTPERIRQVSRRLGVSFKATGKNGVVVKRKPKQKLGNNVRFKVDGYSVVNESCLATIVPFRGSGDG